MLPSLLFTFGIRKNIELQFFPVGEEDVYIDVANSRVSMNTEEANRRINLLQGETQPGEEVAANWWIVSSFRTPDTILFPSSS